jgi:hypothetical protein
MEVQVIIVNEFGEFVGRKVFLNDDQYQSIIDISKVFYTGDAFELTCEDGSFVVFPPDIVQKSILKVTKKIIKEDV